MNIWQWILTHKTKITGALQIAAGAVLGYSSQLQSLMSPRAFAIWTITLGVWTAVLGFLNSHQGDPKE